MQHAGSFRPVEVHLIVIVNYDQLGKVEVRVPALQRIDGPRHLMNAHGHGPLALRLLQPRAQIRMPICIEHRQHVGVKRRLPVLAAEESEGEADHLVLIFILILIEGPDENIARRLEGNGQREGQGVLVRHPPDFFLDCFQLAEVVDALEVANRNLLRGATGHHHHCWPFARFEIWSLGMAISAHKSGAEGNTSCTAPVAVLSTAIKVLARVNNSSTTKGTKEYEGLSPSTACGENRIQNAAPEGALIAMHLRHD